MKVTGIIRAAAALSFFCCAGAWAETRALVVGVSEYRYLPEGQQLRAPRRDAERMVRQLQQIGVSEKEIELLADGAKGSIAMPDHAGINAAFDRLIARARPGDQIVIYLSGHGAQIADDNGDEEDGLDEVFLPTDAKPREEEGKGFDIERAIRDDRIAEVIDQLRIKDAHVWLIVDSCHSGTIARSATGDARAKAVSGADLNLPAAIPARTAKPDGKATSLAAGERLSATGGSLVAFYASQADEISLEIANPAGAPAGEQNWVSAFTDAMLSALASGEAKSYRELLGDTARLLRSGAPPRTRQTPGFDGDLDRPVLGLKELPKTPSITVDNGIAIGGVLAGLETGVIVRLHGENGVATGHAQVSKSDAFGAALRAVRFPCKRQDGVPVCENAADGNDLKAARFASVVSTPTRAPIRISDVANWPGRASVAPRTAIETAFRAAIRSEAGSGIVIDQAKPDFVWRRTPTGYRFQAAWISAAEEEFGPAVTLDSDDPIKAVQAMTEALDRARVVMRLERVRQSFGGFRLGAPEIRTSLIRHQKEADGSCRFADGGSNPLAAEQVVKSCDSASITVKNDGLVPVFVTAFLMDDSWSIKPLGNACRQGAQNRLNPGNSRRIGQLRYSAETMGKGLAPRGRQGVLVSAVPFQAGQAIPFDLCRVINSAPTRSVGSEDDPIEAMLGGTASTRSISGINLDGAALSIETWPVEQRREP